MSKMFDALRRAEAERRKRTEREGNGEKPSIVRTEMPVLPVREPAHVDPTQLRPSRNGDSRATSDFFRELGILRNSIDTFLERKSKRAILFTSSTRGEGTSTLATNYARLLSMEGTERVLLVEMNAREASLENRFRLSGTPGMSHYMAGKVAFAGLAQSPPDVGFDVIHVGEHEPGRLQLQVESAFPGFLEAAYQQYDTVIIDGAPVITSPEIPPLTAMVDGVVVVVKCDKTKREIVQRSLSMIEQFSGNTLGVVLNRKKYYIPEAIYKRI